MQNHLEHYHGNFVVAVNDADDDDDEDYNHLKMQEMKQLMVDHD
jgi:hypothetical protein